MMLIVSLIVMVVALCVCRRKIVMFARRVMTADSKTRPFESSARTSQRRPHPGSTQSDYRYASESQIRGDVLSRNNPRTRPSSVEREKSEDEYGLQSRHAAAPAF
jgi:hypothetical protein